MGQLIIGLGHRARQGKDWAAGYLEKTFQNIHIVHWADELYKEVRHEKYRGLFPLIKKEGNIFSVFDTIAGNGSPIYRLFTVDDVPKLDKIFFDRGISEYDGMEGKDSELLQFWGTDYRRNNFGEDYWVIKGKEQIFRISETTANPIILIPDTRFYNELDAIYFLGGKYAEVQRFNADGTRYYDTGRDKDHPSERTLDDVRYDYLISAISGNTKTIENSVFNIIQTEAARNNYELHFKSNIESIAASLAVA